MLAWERVAHHTHLYVLPAAGAVSFAMGTLAVVGVRWELDRFFALTLVLVGFAAILGSLGSYMCLQPRGDSSPRPKDRGEPAGAETTPPDPMGETTRPTGGSSREARPHSGIGRATTLAHLTQVEDEVWRRWAAPSHASLGAPVVGPVPETAFSPHISGGFAAFPERDADIVLLDGKVEGIAPSQASESARPAARGRAARPSVSDRIPAGPTLSGRPPLWTGPAAVEEAGSPLSERAGLPTSLDAFDHVADLESINPILPRLRPSPPNGPARWLEKARPTSEEGSMRRLCTECSQHLSDFRSWVECRVCRKPICRDCLQESFQRPAAGTCSDCQEKRGASLPTEVPTRTLRQVSFPHSSST